MHCRTYTPSLPLIMGGPIQKISPPNPPLTHTRMHTHTHKDTKKMAYDTPAHYLTKTGYQYFTFANLKPVHAIGFSMVFHVHSLFQ